VSRLEFDQHVHVAVWRKILAEYGAKEGQLADVVPSAELHNLVLG
jgi:hypothetical protein